MDSTFFGSISTASTVPICPGRLVTRALPSSVWITAPRVKTFLRTKWGSAGFSTTVRILTFFARPVWGSITFAESVRSKPSFLFPPNVRKFLDFLGPILGSRNSLPISRLRLPLLAHTRPPLGFFRDLPCHLAISIAEIILLRCINALPRQFFDPLAYPVHVVFEAEVACESPRCPEHPRTAKRL